MGRNAGLHCFVGLVPFNNGSERPVMFSDSKQRKSTLPKDMWRITPTISTCPDHSHSSAHGVYPLPFSSHAPPSALLQLHILHHFSSHGVRLGTVKGSVRSYTPLRGLLLSWHVCLATACQVGKSWPGGKDPHSESSFASRELSNLGLATCHYYHLHLGGVWWGLNEGTGLGASLPLSLAPCTLQVGTSSSSTYPSAPLLPDPFQVLP